MTQALYQVLYKLLPDELVHFQYGEVRIKVFQFYQQQLAILCTAGIDEAVKPPYKTVKSLYKGTTLFESLCSGPFSFEDDAFHRKMSKFEPWNTCQSNDTMRLQPS